MSYRALNLSIKQAVIFVTVAGLFSVVSGCRWNSDYRVHAKPEDHARMMDYKEFLEPKDEKRKAPKDNEEVDDPNAPNMVMESFEDKAQRGRLEQTITESMIK